MPPSRSRSRRSHEAQYRQADSVHEFTVVTFTILPSKPAEVHAESLKRVALRSGYDSVANRRGHGRSRVLIIGGGIAGLTLGRALRLR